MGIEVQFPESHAVHITFNRIGQLILNGYSIPVTVNSNNMTVVDGTTKGQFSYSEYEVLGVKIVEVHFHNYSNTTSTSQTITFPVAFTSTPYLIPSEATLTIVQDATTGAELGTGTPASAYYGVSEVLSAGTIIEPQNMPKSDSVNITTSLTELTIPSETTNVATGTLLIIGN